LKSVAPDLGPRDVKGNPRVLVRGVTADLPAVLAEKYARSGIVEKEEDALAREEIAAQAAAAQEASAKQVMAEAKAELKKEK
jgi:hypothetical protein